MSYYFLIVKTLEIFFARSEEEEYENFHVPSFVPYFLDILRIQGIYKINILLKDLTTYVKD